MSLLIRWLFAMMLLLPPGFDAVASVESRTMDYAWVLFIGVPQNNFLANYTNPEQQSLPADGLYPAGQRMWLSSYSNTAAQLVRMKDAGFTLSGPFYNNNDRHPDIDIVGDYGLKTFFGLYVGTKSWSTILSMMETDTGRTYLRNRVLDSINYVLSDLDRNKAVAAWYGFPDEPFPRGSTDDEKIKNIEGKRAYIKLVSEVIIAKDSNKRPLFWSDRTDATNDQTTDYLLTGNSVDLGGLMKQNYLIKNNVYYYGLPASEQPKHRFLMGHWVREQLAAAEYNDVENPSYTGKNRPVISTLSMYVDPDNEIERTETWLRKAITHDFYLQVAIGAHGFNMYTWNASGTQSKTTVKLQEDLYIDIIGTFAKAGLGKVFLWGDHRDDIDLIIEAGPETFQWKRYWKTYIEPSIKFHNIQYGNNRYILLVNSSQEPIEVLLTGFPDGVKILDIIQDKWSDLGTSIMQTIQPLGVRMYKISRK